MDFPFPCRTEGNITTQTQLKWERGLFHPVGTCLVFVQLWPASSVLQPSPGCVCVCVSLSSFPDVIKEQNIKLLTNNLNPV